MKPVMRTELNKLSERLHLLANNLMTIRTDNDYVQAAHDLRTVEAILNAYRYMTHQVYAMAAANEIDVATLTREKPRQECLKAA